VALLAALSGNAAFTCLSTRGLQSLLEQDGPAVLSAGDVGVLWAPWLQLPPILANVTLGLMVDRYSGGYFMVRSNGR
jgi:hypothetical protein